MQLSVVLVLVLMLVATFVCVTANGLPALSTSATVAAADGSLSVEISAGGVTGLSPSVGSKSTFGAAAGEQLFRFPWLESFANRT